jgi:uncharacterized protein YfbU (UPF0304 family)
MTDARRLILLNQYRILEETTGGDFDRQKMALKAGFEEDALLASELEAAMPSSLQEKVRGVLSMHADVKRWARRFEMDLPLGARTLSRFQRDRAEKYAQFLMEVWETGGLKRSEETRRIESYEPALEAYAGVRDGEPGPAGVMEIAKKITGELA